MASIIVATAFGGPEVLSVIEEEVPAPGPGEVAVSVRAAGTNPVDHKVYSGAFGTEAPLPMRLGFEAAGVVSAVGSDDVDGPGGPILVGDEVVVYRIEGAYASELVVPAATVLPKPSTLSFDEAAGLMLTGTTAVHALAATAVGEGDTVLVHGAAGGVGLMVVQLAVAAGARVVGTASEGRHAVLAELGAEPVSYGDGLLERVRVLAPGGLTAAIDCVGTDEALDVSTALVADRDRIATVANFDRAATLGIKMLGGGPGADPGTAVRAAARIELVHQAEAGLRVLVAGTRPFSEVAEAHRELAEGHTPGKIILVP